MGAHLGCFLPPCLHHSTVGTQTHLNSLCVAQVRTKWPRNLPSGDSFIIAAQGAAQRTHSSKEPLLLKRFSSLLFSLSHKEDSSSSSSTCAYTFTAFVSAHTHTHETNARKKVIDLCNTWRRKRKKFPMRTATTAALDSSPCSQ